MENPSDNLSLNAVHVPERCVNSVPFSIEKRPLRSYWEDVGDYNIEEVSAALARVETVLRCLGYTPPSRASAESSARDAEPFATSAEFLAALLSAMKREPALRAYLDAHRKYADDPPDSLAAWAAASGDVAFLLALRERGWEPAVSRYINITKSVFIPIIFIALTAFLGNCIATDLQREAFKHQRTFDVRLVELQKGQDRAAELYTSINEMYSTIADLEEQKYTGIRTNKLRAERQKLDSIHAAARLYDSEDIAGNAMANAGIVLDKYIECLDSKDEIAQANPGKEMNCSQQNTDILVVFNKILEAHTLAMEKLVNSNS